MAKVKGLFGFKLGDKNSHFTLHGEDIGGGEVTEVVSTCDNGDTIVWEELDTQPQGNKKLRVTGKPVKRREGKPGVLGDLVGDMTVTVSFGAPTETVRFTSIAYEE